MKNRKKLPLYIGLGVAVLVLAAAGIAIGKHMTAKPGSAAQSLPAAAEQTGLSSHADTAPAAGSAKGDTGLYPDFFTYFYQSESVDYILDQNFFYEAPCVYLEEKKSENTNYFDPFGSVPGIPFLFDYDHAQNIKTGYTVPDTVIIQYSAGTCSTLSGESGVAFPSGQSFARPITVYWNPYTSPNGEAAKEATVTAQFMVNGKEISRQELTLKRGKSIKGSQGSVYRYSIRVSSK